MVLRAYEGEEFEFGRHYIIPKPFDPRVLWYVAPAVAKAAMDTGVAGINIEDWEAYKEKLKERLGLSKEVIRVMVQKAKKNPKRVVYPDGEDEKIIRAANTVAADKIANPILLGNEETIKSIIANLGYSEDGLTIVDPTKNDKKDEYAQKYFDKRKRKGVTLRQSKQLMNKPNYFGPMMVDSGDADAYIGGLNAHYPRTIKPALQCIGVKDGFKVVSGLYIVIAKNEVYFFADTTVNINPTSEELAQIAISAADTVKGFDIDPKVAMLSFSNFGSSSSPEVTKVNEAVKRVKELRPDLIIDGEMQADTAVVPEIIENDFPFSNLKGRANVLVFPDLNSGNIAYKLMARIGQATVVGPILMGMKKPIHVLQRNAPVEDIIKMTAIAVAGAETLK